MVRVWDDRGNSRQQLGSATFFYAKYTGEFWYGFAFWLGGTAVVGASWNHAGDGVTVGTCTDFLG